MYKQISKELNFLKNPAKVKILQRFFKTGPGEYGAGDKFLGIVVPAQRQVAKKYYQTATLVDVKKLLASPWHEYRLVGLLILTYKFPHSNDRVKKQIYNFYLQNISRINNWDLVDLSADKIVGDYLFDQPDKKILYHLAKSKNLWARRIAVLATFYFIKQNKFSDTLRLAKLLIRDEHDLLHKAVGWMLREIGKRDQKVLEKFLNQYYHQMPRTMLRYAIERLPVKLKNKYMTK
jgi:3-methyladenine DNA glycosylase AlkD